MPRTPMVAALVVIASLGCRPSGPTLRTRVETLIDKSGPDTVAVYYRDLLKPDSLLILPDRRFHAASTMKVPVMIQLFRDADAGRFALTDSVMVTNTFHSLLDGSVYHLDPSDDSDSTMYLRVGQRVPIDTLIEHMITVSSNLATNNLIDLVDPKRVQATMRTLGADSIAVLRGVEDIKAYDAGMNNTTTARDLGIIFTAIAQNEAASPAACRQMEAILSRQEFNEGIPAGLPSGTRVAHKTGWITGIHHDASIVFGPNGPRYVLVILTQGIDSIAKSGRLMADITREINAEAP